MIFWVVKKTSTLFVCIRTNLSHWHRAFCLAFGSIATTEWKWENVYKQSWVSFFLCWKAVCEHCFYFYSFPCKHTHTQTFYNFFSVPLFSLIYDVAFVAAKYLVTWLLAKDIRKQNIFLTFGQCSIRAGKNENNAGKQYEKNRHTQREHTERMRERANTEINKFSFVLSAFESKAGIQILLKENRCKTICNRKHLRIHRRQNDLLLFTIHDNCLFANFILYLISTQLVLEHV